MTWTVSCQLDNYFNLYDSPARAKRIWEDYCKEGVPPKKQEEFLMALQEERTCEGLDFALDRILG